MKSNMHKALLIVIGVPFLLLKISKKTWQEIFAGLILAVPIIVMEWLIWVMYP